MKVRVLCVGSPGRVLAAPIREFEIRAARYFDLDVVEVRPGRGEPDRIVQAEGEALLARVPERHRVLALTRSGSELSSRELAAELSDIATYGPGGSAWIVGGAFGLSPTVLAAADRRISLSSLTLPHEFARLVLAEQLYRAGTILRGEPYHKGD